MTLRLPPPPAGKSWALATWSLIPSGANETDTRPPPCDYCYGRGTLVVPIGKRSTFEATAKPCPKCGRANAILEVTR